MASATTSVSIPSMKCAGCVAAVQQALSEAPGVRSATVDLPQKRALVEYDPEATSPETLADVVRRAGYEAAVLPEA